MKLRRLERTGSSFPSLMPCCCWAGHLHGPAEEGALHSPADAAEQVGATKTLAATIAHPVSYLGVTVLAPISLLGVV